jgi:MFS family permease
MLLVVFLARTAMGFQFQSVASVSPLLVHDLGMDLALFGTLIGAWMLPGAAIAIPGGMLGRRFGDKRVALLGLAMMAAGSALTAGALGYASALSGRLVSGAGAVLLNVLLAKMVADWFGQRNLATAMGILVVSWPLGIGLALIVLGPLAAATSWKLALELAAAVCIAAMLMVALVYRDPPQGIHSTAQVHSGALTRKELALASLSGAVWATYNAAYIIVVSFAPLLLAERGFSSAEAARVASAATWPLILSIPFGGVLADRTGRGELIMHGSFVSMALCIPFMAAAVSPSLMLAMIGLAMGPAAGIIMVMPARILRPEARGLGMGVYYTWYYVVMATLPGVAGWCRDRSGIASAPLLLASALLLAAIVSALVFRRLERAIVRRAG